MNTDPSTPDHHTRARRTFALRINRVATLTALGVTDKDYHARLLSRQCDWLACLINPADENVTYDLRIISEPNAHNFLRGRLTVALLCSLDNATPTQARDFASDLKSLCEAFFDDEYEFELISEAAAVEQLRKPFAVRAFAEIARRAASLPLDTLQSQRNKRLGFLQEHTDPRPEKVEVKVRGASAATVPDPSSQEFTAPSTIKPAPERRVFHIFPYLLNTAPLTRLQRLLLLQASPLLISVHLRPTTLSDEEEKFLESQIARCERYSQLSLGHGEQLDALWPTLQQQARVLQVQFVKKLYALKDNAALLRVEVASAGERVPQVVLDSLGSSLTLPAGGSGRSSEVEAYLSGGYEFTHYPDAGLNLHAETSANLSLDIDENGNSSETAPPRLRYLFDAFEATTAFRFPLPTLEESPGLPSKTSRTQPAPANIPETGQCIGESYHNGRGQAVFLSAGDRRRHIYVVGQTGTGKTTLFESMILDDIRAGQGVGVFDPHGDLIEKLLPKIPESRMDDVILLDPADVERPIGLNILEYETEAEKYFLVQEILAILERLFDDKYTGSASVTGPLFYQHVRMILLLCMSNPDDVGTILQFHQVFNSPDFYKRFLPLRSKDPVLQKFVEGPLARTDYLRPGSDNYPLGSYISNKFDGFVGDPMLRNIFGQQRSMINLRQIMDERKILLVNLSKGRLGEINSRFFGMLLIAKLQAAAMARASVPIEQRKDFYLYVDEFQSLATLNFGTLLSEARKYRLNLVLTNQYIAQVDPRISSAISGNVGTLIAFRTGAPDAEFLERDFLPVFNRYDIMQLPNFTTCVSTLIDGQVSRPFTMRNRLDTVAADPRAEGEVRERSRRRYGQPRDVVEDEILRSLRYEPV